VVAVEPAAAMRAVARAAPPNPRVHLVGGAAERIPLRCSCEVGWVACVVHHITDLDGCAAELARVLRGAGWLFIAGAFPGRLDDISLFRFFPEARAVAEQFPTVERVSLAFARAGFEPVAV